MKRILIVTAWYAPFIHPRAHRWTSLACHWAAQGHEVHVVCARQRGEPLEAVTEGVHVHRTGFDSLKEVFYYYISARGARGRVGQSAQKPGLIGRVLAFFYRYVWQKLYFPDDALLWIVPAFQKARWLMEANRFDRVITVSFPFSGHVAGLRLKRRFPDMDWLVDVGDPFSNGLAEPNNSLLYKKRSRALEETIFNTCDAIAVTTEKAAALEKSTFGPAVIEKIRVIPPLLHPLLKPSLPTPRPITSSLKIGYFGAFYKPVRTPDAFLALLERLKPMLPHLEKTLEIHLYGEVFPEFLPAFEAQPMIRLHGLQSRAIVRQAMQDMDVLLNIGNQTDFQLPSKAIEYLSTGIPVLHLQYVPDDPFVAVFENWEGLLSVDAHHPDFELLMAFLKYPPQPRSVTIEQYGVEALGKKYLD